MEETPLITDQDLDKLLAARNFEHRLPSGLLVPDYDSQEVFELPSPYKGKVTYSAEAWDFRFDGIGNIRGHVLLARDDTIPVERTRGILGLFGRVVTEDIEENMWSINSEEDTEDTDETDEAPYFIKNGENATDLTDPHSYRGFLVSKSLNFINSTSEESDPSLICDGLLERLFGKLDRRLKEVSDAVMKLYKLRE